MKRREKCIVWHDCRCRIPRHSPNDIILVFHFLSRPVGNESPHLSAFPCAVHDTPCAVVHDDDWDSIAHPDVAATA